MVVYVEIGEILLALYHQSFSNFVAKVNRIFDLTFGFFIVFNNDFIKYWFLSQ